MTYSVNAADFDSVDGFAERIEDLSPQKAADFQAFVLTEGLMKLPFPFGIITGILRLLKGKQGIRNFVYIIADKHPELLERWVFDTVTHILYGNDKEDVKSVGGFSQRECDLITKNIYFDE